MDLSRFEDLQPPSPTTLECVERTTREVVDSSVCEGEGDVVAVVASLGGVAQVVSHGVKVVGVHEEEGKEKDEEVRVEVKGEVEKLREKRSSWMAWR